MQEKTNKDHTIRGMNDEIAHQDELINKLNKEKKHMAESQVCLFETIFPPSHESTVNMGKCDLINFLRQMLVVGPTAGSTFVLQ